MKREQIDRLIADLTVAARNDPAGFTRRVARFAAFGYAYIAGVLALLAALLLGLVVLAIGVPNGFTFKLAIGLGIAALSMAWSILVALRVRHTPPEGIRLHPGDAPALFDRVRQIAEKVGSPDFDEIQIVPEYNAAVVQHPRLGIFGWHRNYLLIGLPLLHSLTEEEFTAVLAHEFGHLSRSHGRLGNWLYRLRQSWINVLERLEAHPPGAMAILLTAFIRWYWPRFNARSFVLGRLQEYDADATAASVAGASALASALTRLHVDGPHLDEVFWKELSQRANHDAEPPPDIYRDLGRQLAGGAPAGRAAQWLRAAFLLETNNTDTHPCLKDRLRALGQLPESIARAEYPTEPPPRRGPTAARALLGAALPSVESRLGEEWRNAVRPGWAVRHEEVTRLQQELARLEAGSSHTPPSPDELWKQAELRIQLEGDAAALPLIDRILALAPAHAPAHFVRGRHLLESDDPAGVDSIELAIAADSQFIEPGCQLLYGHYARTGQRTRLRSIEERLDQYAEEKQGADAERNRLTATDTWLPHGLGPEALAPVVQALEPEPEVRRARLVRKQVRHLQHIPCFVLAVEVSRPFWKPVASDANHRLVQRILDRMQFSGYVVAFVVADDMKSVGRKIAKSGGSLIFQRG